MDSAKQEASARAAELSRVLHYHNYRYYVLDSPEVLDAAARATGY